MVNATRPSRADYYKVLADKLPANALVVTCLGKFCRSALVTLTFSLFNVSLYGISLKTLYSWLCQLYKVGCNATIKIVGEDTATNTWPRFFFSLEFVWTTP